ncbi:MAG: YeeE/YedE family protein [Candidatus Omnitrophica bacterium]|nr:YeeE/YedE family protein [Candidatus Omnitrophota bacterium]
MNISYAHGFLGGMLIGLAAVLLYWFNGRIMGVSGITSRLLAKPDQDTSWRAAFVIALIAGGFVYQLKWPVIAVINTTEYDLIIAGLLVGFGTVLGNGCTSGHGICGIARRSKPSLVATFVFMVTGIFVVWLKRMVGI